eukprot:3564266-Rhodomonas_salina.1
MSPAEPAAAATRAFWRVKLAIQQAASLSAASVAACTNDAGASTRRLRSSTHSICATTHRRTSRRSANPFTWS